MRDPASAATDSRSCCMSLSTRTNSPADIGLNSTAAAPPGLIPSSTSSVTAAAERPKSLSRAAETGRFRRPNSATRLHRAAHLARNLRERSETLLERRMGHEQLGAALLPVGRDDEER